MEFLQPNTWADALAAKAEHPDAVCIAGGTDVMVDINFDRRRPPALLDLNRVPELSTWTREDGTIRLGAGVPYARIITDLADELPALAIASRTVGSPQIRNRGTVGGNLGSASPAGDAHPPLLATGAVVHVESVRGRRPVPIEEFFQGVKRSALASDELIESVVIPTAGGPQQFAKIGTRNAMVIAVCSFALALHPHWRRIGTGIGSAAPTPRRAAEAEQFLSTTLNGINAWDNRPDLDADVVAQFGRLVAAAAAPIDDVRGSAAYRRRALEVMATRTLVWAWRDYQGSR